MEQEFEIPPEMTYNVPSLKRNETIDWEKLNYNESYKSYGFYASKFTGDYSHIPGFDKIIENMAKNAKYPLEGWLIRQQKSTDILEHDIKESDTNIIEFKDSEQVLEQ